MQANATEYWKSAYGMGERIEVWYEQRLNFLFLVERHQDHLKIKMDGRIESIAFDSDSLFWDSVKIGKL